MGTLFLFHSPAVAGLSQWIWTYQLIPIAEISPRRCQITASWWFYRRKVFLVDPLTSVKDLDPVDLAELQPHIKHAAMRQEKDSRGYGGNSKHLRTTSACHQHGVNVYRIQCGYLFGKGIMVCVFVAAATTSLNLTISFRLPMAEAVQNAISSYFAKPAIAKKGKASDSGAEH